MRRGVRIEPTNELAEEVIEQRIKVIIVGEPGAGKKEVASSADVCMPFKTLGVSLGKKTNIDKKINYQLTLLFWTLTKGRPKKTTYFEGAGAAIIMGNLNKRKSLKTMQSWAISIRDNLGTIPLFFIGTMEDSKSKKNQRLLSKLADQFNSRYFVLLQDQEFRLKTIMKSIAKHIAKSYSKIILENVVTPASNNT
jgi:hypothetical protein